MATFPILTIVKPKCKSYVTNNPDRIPDAPKIVTKRTGKHYSTKTRDSRPTSPQVSHLYEDNGVPNTSPTQFIEDTDSQNGDYEKFSNRNDTNEDKMVESTAAEEDTNPVENLINVVDIFANPTPSTSLVARKTIIDLLDEEYDQDGVSGMD